MTRPTVLVPILVVATSLAVILPWEATLLRHEGRVVPLSTSHGYNLYRLATGVSDPEARERISAYAQEHGIDYYVAARAMATQAVQDDPLSLPARSWRSLRGSWSGDWILLRHVFGAHYPPLSQSAALWIVVLVQGGVILLISAATLGLLSRPRKASFSSARGLVLGVATLAILTPLLAPANSRLMIPAAATLLPFAGRGVSVVNPARSRSLILSCCVTVFAAGLVLVNMRQTGWLGASSYYAEATDWLEPIVRGKDFRDRVFLRADSGSIEIVGVQPTAIRSGADAMPDGRVKWSTGSDSQALITLVGEHRDARLRITVLKGSELETTTIEPLTRAAWHYWQPTGIDGVMFQWLGR